VEDIKFWLTLLGGPVLGAVSAWAVMLDKVQRIDHIEPEIAFLKTAVAVLQSKQDDHGNRIDGFTDAIQQMEKRIVEQVKQLFEAFTKGGRS
jgi:hypothetical protein